MRYGEVVHVMVQRRVDIACVQKTRARERERERQGERERGRERERENTRRPSTSQSLNRLPSG